jgi:predicted RND superfamily exporter protein
MLLSITRVIADDDTIQFLTRFRRRFMQLKRAGHHDPHQQASVDTLRETGVPMVITSIAISTGFLVLLGSRFLGLSHLGALTGISLFAAVFADLFLSPVLLTTIRPRIGRGGGRLPTATANPPDRP